jgi:regulator of protease activity HflC (stomatin/prohibitin superfamily)
MSNGIVAAGITAVVGGIVALTILGGSWYTVDQGDRGVILRNGAVTGIAEPGLGFKLPIFDSVIDISVRSNSRIYEQVAAYSRDQQTAIMKVSVSYRLPEDQIKEIYAEYGSEEGVLARLVDRQVNNVVENVFGQFNAVTAIGERERLVAEVQNELQAAVRGPVIVESVQIENIDFSDAYENAIEQRMTAEVEVQKVRQNAEREKVTAEITVIQAQANADAQLAQATASAEAIRIQGEAEADAIRAKAEALRGNEGLIQLTQAERWDGKLPTSMIPGSAVPFIDVGPQQ